MSTKEKQKAEKLHQSAASLGRRIQELAGVQGLHDAITEHVLTIASLRAANKKLRAELASARESVACGQRMIDRLAAEGETLENVVRMFVNAK